MMENKYVEMICILADQLIVKVQLPEGIDLHGLEGVDEEALYRCYYQAFEAGDAPFFFQQNEAERRAFFDTLCFEDARREPGSAALFDGDQLVGFSYIIPYGDDNRHISCMAVHPDYQGRGLGDYLVLHAIAVAESEGHRTITLGTDTNMKAFHLYRKHGFQVRE